MVERSKVLFCFWSQRVEGLQCSHLLQRSSVTSAVEKFGISRCLYVCIHVHHMIYAIYIWYDMKYINFILQTYIRVCESYHMHIYICTYLSIYEYILISQNIHIVSMNMINCMYLCHHIFKIVTVDDCSVWTAVGKDRHKVFLLHVFGWTARILDGHNMSSNYASWSCLKPRIHQLPSIWMNNVKCFRMFLFLVLECRRRHKQVKITGFWAKDIQTVFTVKVLCWSVKSGIWYG